MKEEDILESRAVILPPCSSPPAIMEDWLP
jgi:hypothetical protein